MFSTSALPVPGSSRAFAGSNSYGVADLPLIDVLARAPHDHHGHLGHATVAALCPRVPRVVTALGVGPTCAAGATGPPKSRS